MSEAKREAEHQGVELLIMPTAQAIKELEDSPTDTNALLPAADCLRGGFRSEDGFEGGFYFFHFTFASGAGLNSLSTRTLLSA
jgi:hypothetical protein